MTEESRGESAGELEIELPPALVQFLNDVKTHQRKLLRDKAYANGDQLRKFIATTFMEMFVQAIEMMGTTMYDTHQLGVSNARQIQRMRRWSAKHLRKLGADVNDGDAFAEAGTEQLDAVAQTVYALGSHLQAKYPGDVDTQEKYNAFVAAFQALMVVLMGDQSVEDDDEEEEEEEPGGDGDDDPVVLDEADDGAGGDPEVSE